HNIIPGIIARTIDFYSIAAVTIDADGELVGGLICIPKTGTISKIGFRVVSVTTTDTLKVSIQGIDDTNGRPDGVIAASGTLSTPSANTTNWVALDSSLAVTRGQEIAIVVEFNDFVGEGSDGNLQIGHRISGIAPSNIQYNFSFTGGVWVFNSRIPNFGIEYNDGMIEPVINCFPVANLVSFTFNNTDNPNRIGMRFQVPYTCRIDGMFFFGDIDANANIILYDSDGISPLETVLIDKDVRLSVFRTSYYVQFTGVQILTRDTYYRIVIVPLTGSDITLFAFSVTDDGANKAMNAVDGGTFFHSTTANGAPTEEADWTQTLTQRPIMGLVVDKLDDGIGQPAGHHADGRKNELP
ncbi:hypothetical protein LCGC14_2683150, partial [marine sediment metagenome]